MTRTPHPRRSKPTAARLPAASTTPSRSRDRQHPGTLLGVWAHPDDETYMSGGLMAAARRAGHRVVVLTMTAGERGTNDPHRWPPARLGALRRHELRAGLAALDVEEHHVIGLPDGGCDRFDGTRLVAAAIERVRPTTVVTFGPDGFTGHPDHIAVSEWTTRAWHATGRAGALWYATVTPSFHADHGDLNAAIDLWSMHEATAPPCDSPESLAHQVHLRDGHLDQKVAALRAHASQTTDTIRLVGDDRYRTWWATESFRAAPLEPRIDEQPFADLLAA